MQSNVINLFMKKYINFIIYISVINNKIYLIIVCV